MRILFATDLHGSTIVLRKAIKAAIDFEVDCLIIGGDVSGKRMLPIMQQVDHTYVAGEPYKQKDDSGKSVDIASLESIPESGLAEYVQRLESKGYYWHFVTPDELKRLNEHTSECEALFQAKIYERLLTWAGTVSETLPDSVKCFWTGGNDDDNVMLERLAKEDLGSFVYVEERVVHLGDYQLISVGYSNKTPFYRPRELEEEELMRLLESRCATGTISDRLILNVHVPPANCGNLDLCVDPDHPDHFIHVGSTAVRAFIENMQPLADFVGHVHEGKGSAKIGRTQIFNPGSDYNAGVLQAYVVLFKASKVKDYLHICR